MNLKQLFEELAGEVKVFDRTTKVYKNPYSEEVRTLIQMARKSYDEVRFAIDRRKGKSDVYIWPADLMHDRVAKKFDLPYPHKEMMYGVARVLDNGKMEANSSYTSGRLKRSYQYYHRKIKEVPKEHDIYKDAALEHKISKVDYKKHISRNWKNKWIDVTKLLKKIKDISEDQEENYDYDT